MISTLSALANFAQQQQQHNTTAIAKATLWLYYMQVGRLALFSSEVQVK